jgi:hypothetical protein
MNASCGDTITLFMLQNGESPGRGSWLWIWLPKPRASMSMPVKAVWATGSALAPAELVRMMPLGLSSVTWACWPAPEVWKLIYFRFGAASIMPR